MSERDRMSAMNKIFDRILEENMPLHLKRVKIDVDKILKDEKDRERNGDFQGYTDEFLEYVQDKRDEVFFAHQGDGYSRGLYSLAKEVSTIEELQNPEPSDLYLFSEDLLIEVKEDKGEKNE